MYSLLRLKLESVHGGYQLMSIAICNRHGKQQSANQRISFQNQIGPSDGFFILYYLISLCRVLKSFCTLHILKLMDSKIHVDQIDPNIFIASNVAMDTSCEPFMSTKESQCGRLDYYLQNYAQRHYISCSLLFFFNYF